MDSCSTVFPWPNKWRHRLDMYIESNEDIPCNLLIDGHHTTSECWEMSMPRVRMAAMVCARTTHSCEGHSCVGHSCVCPQRSGCTLVPIGHVRFMLACPESVLLTAWRWHDPWCYETRHHYLRWKPKHDPQCRDPTRRMSKECCVRKSKPYGGKYDSHVSCNMSVQQQCRGQRRV